MSELKGQLLGIILVIAVFGAVIGILTATFQNSAEVISKRVEDVAYTGTEKSSTSESGRLNYSWHM